jgi:hypothetical protein
MTETSNAVPNEAITRGIVTPLPRNTSRFKTFAPEPAAVINPDATQRLQFISSIELINNTSAVDPYRPTNLSEVCVRVD